MRNNLQFTLSAAISIILLSNSAWALNSTTSCGDQVYDFFYNCKNGIQPSNFEETFANIKSSCFCGPAMSNDQGSGDASCSTGSKSEIVISPNNNQTQVGTGSCEIFNGTNNYYGFTAMSQYCNASNSNYKATLMHEFSSSLRNMTRNQGDLQNIANNCSQYVKYVSDTNALLNIRDYTGFIVSNNSLDMQWWTKDNNSNYYNPNAILIAGYQISLPRNNTNYGYVLTPDEVRLYGNSQLIGQINSHRLDIQSESSPNLAIQQPDADENCAHCVFSDAIKPPTLKLAIKPNTCAPASVGLNLVSSENTSSEYTDSYSDNNVKITITYTNADGSTSTETKTLSVSSSSAGSLASWITLDNNANYNSVKISATTTDSLEILCADNFTQNSDGSCQSKKIGPTACQTTITNDSSYVNDFINLSITYSDNVTLKDVVDLAKTSIATENQISADTLTLDTITATLGISSSVESYIKTERLGNTTLINSNIDNPQSVKNVAITCSAQGDACTEDYLLTNSNPKLYPRLIVNSLIPNKDILQISKISLNISFKDTNNTSYSTSGDVKDLEPISLTSSPLAYCINLSNPIEQNKGLILYPNAFYKYSQRVVGCPNGTLCDEEKPYSLTQLQLKKLCTNDETNDSGINAVLPSGISESDNGTVIDALNAINPQSYNQFLSSPENYTDTILGCKPGICQASIKKDTQDPTTPSPVILGNTLSSNLTNATLAFSDIGWFSFSNIKPLTSSTNTLSNIKTFFFSPVYTVAPHHLTTVSSDAEFNAYTYDYYLNNNILSSYFDLAENSTATDSNALTISQQLKKRISPTYCPAYLSQKLTTFGYVRIADIDSNSLANLPNEYLKNNSANNFNIKFFTLEKGTSSTPELIVKKYSNAENVQSTANEYHEEFAINKYIADYGFPFKVDYRLTNDYKQPQNSFIGLEGYIDFLVANHTDISDNAVTTSNEAYSIYTSNNLTKQAKKYQDFDTWIVENGDVDGNGNSLTPTPISYNDSSYTSNHLHALIVGESNPITAYKGRLVSEVIYGKDFAIHVPITIHYYDGNSWLLNTNDSCSFLNLYDANSEFSSSFNFINGDGNSVNTDTEGNFKITNNGNLHTILTLESAPAETNPVVKNLTKEFSNGQLILRSSVPSSYNDNSYTTFTFRSFSGNDPENLSLTKSLNYLDHLLDDTTSRGGFIYKGKSTNVRIIEQKMIYK